MRLLPMLFLYRGGPLAFQSQICRVLEAGELPVWGTPRCKMGVANDGEVDGVEGFRRRGTKQLDLFRIAVWALSFCLSRPHSNCRVPVLCRMERGFSYNVFVVQAASRRLLTHTANPIHATFISADMEACSQRRQYHGAWPRNENRRSYFSR